MKERVRRVLPNPRVEVVRDRGRVDAVFVSIQARKATRGIHPRPDLLYYVEVDETAFPVGLALFERVDALGVVRDVLDLVLRDGRSARGTPFADPAYLGRLYAAVKAACARLPRRFTLAAAR